MSEPNLIEVLIHALYITMMTVGLLVLPALIVGLLVSIFQAATQINEMSLNFLPKLFAIVITMVILGPWLFSLLVSFTQTLFTELPFMIS